MNFTKFRVVLFSVLTTLVIGSCSVNPVTGKNDLLFVSEAWELDVGKQNYLPLRQSQGGDYTADPGVEEYVRSIGQKLAAHSDRPLPYEFHVINDSVPNAWALPGGKISINRGLLVELKDEAELSAVLAHEIVHSAAKHGARGQSRGILLQGAVIAATIAGSREGYGQAAQATSSIAAQLTNQKYGRSAELESDLYGMRYMSKAGYDPQGAVDLQQTFVRLSEGQQTDFISGLFASHPPSQERVQKNRETAKALPAGGDRGAARYAKAMSRLTKTESAYETFGNAQKALKENKIQEAVNLTKKAIRIEPREGHFQSFLGDISIQTNNYKAAKSYFDKAVKLNPNFYYYLVRRGEVNQRNGNASAARSDYEASMKLLPSAEAQYGLGLIEKNSGNTAVAKKMFASAAQSKSPIGQKATDELLALDLGDNPQTYLTVNRGLSKNGTFAFQLVNNTSRPLTGIALGVIMGDGSQSTSNVSGTLAGGETKLIDTGRRMSKAQADSIKVRVINVDVKS